MSDISTPEKLRALGIDMTINLSDKYIDQLYELNIIKSGSLITSKKSDTGITRVQVRKEFDKTDPKYAVLLKLLNMILSSVKIRNIRDIYEFREIDQNVIVAHRDSLTLFGMENEIFKYYSKVKSSWENKDQYKNYIIHFILYACRTLGVNFVSREKQTSVRSDTIYKIVYSII